MKLKVLGNTGRYLAPLAAGSSYLLEHEGVRILLDAGYGAREAIAALDTEPLDAVWISHMHRDHVLDLPSIGGALEDDARIYVPRGERRRLDAMAEALVWGSPFEMQGGVVEVEAGEELRVGKMRVTFARGQHSAPVLAARFEAEGRAFVYASDGAPCDAVRALAADADLLLMHALLPTVDAGSEHARIHSTADTAGAMAAEVGARRLLLSHRYWESPDGAMREAAASHFDGAAGTRWGRGPQDASTVELARDGEEYVV